MSGSNNGVVKEKVTPETAPLLTNMEQVQELYEYAVKALESLRAQQQEIAIQIERQIGMISGLEILIGGKAEETLQQIREAIKKGQQNGVQDNPPLDS